MAPKDWVLFSKGGSGLFGYKGRILHKVESDALGRSLWSFEFDKPWSLVYFLEDVEQVAIPKMSLLGSFEYSPDDRLMGLRRVPQNKLDRALRRHGTMEAFLESVAKPVGGAEATSQRDQTYPTNVDLGKTMADESGGTVVGEFAKNKREYVRIELTKFKGLDLLSLRIWYKSEDGQVLPSKSGFALRIELLPILLEILGRAKALAHERGLLGTGGAGQTESNDPFREILDIINGTSE